MKGEKLSGKQLLFAKEYLVDLNATQAAKRAGYSEKTAASIGLENLSKPLIAAAIKKEIGKRERRVEMDMDWVMIQYKRLAAFDIRKAYDENGNLKPIRDLDDDTAAAISSIESEEIYSGGGIDRANIGKLSKIKTYDKRAALSDVTKHLGGFEKDNRQKGDGKNTNLNVDFKDLPADQKMKILQSLMQS